MTAGYAILYKKLQHTFNNYIINIRVIGIWPACGILAKFYKFSTIVYLPRPEKTVILKALESGRCKV